MHMSAIRCYFATADFGTSQDVNIVCAQKSLCERCKAPDEAHTEADSKNGLEVHEHKGHNADAPPRLFAVGFSASFDLSLTAPDSWSVTVASQKIKDYSMSSILSQTVVLIS